MNTQRKNFNTIMKSVKEVMKAEEGDKRTIFGRPSTYTSGAWVADEGAPEEEAPAEEVSPEEEMIDTEPEEDDEPDPITDRDMNNFIEQNLDKLQKMAEDALVENNISDRKTARGLAQDANYVEDFESILGEDALMALYIENNEEEAPEDEDIDVEGMSADIYEQFADELNEDGRDALNEAIADLDPQEVKHMNDTRDYSALDDVVNAPENQEDYEDEEDDEYEGSAEKACPDKPKGQQTSPKDGTQGGVMKSQERSFNKVQKALADTYDQMTKTGGTTTDEEHSHGYKIDIDGNGATTSQIGSHGIPHTHSIKDYKVSTVNSHSHEVI